MFDHRLSFFYTMLCILVNIDAPTFVASSVKFWEEMSDAWGGRGYTKDCSISSSLILYTQHVMSALYLHASLSVIDDCVRSVSGHLIIICRAEAEAELYL